MVMSIAQHSTPAMISLMVTDSQDDPEVMQNICYEETLNYLPELIGKFYLDRFAKLSPNWRNEVEKVVHLLTESFHEVLNNTSWMDRHASEMAINKLVKMTMHIGSPDWYNNEEQFGNYSSMVS